MFTHIYTNVHIHSHTHLNVPVGQQQVHHYIRGEQLYTVQAFLDATQLVTQLFTAEPLPCHSNLMPDGLPEVLTVSIEKGAIQHSLIKLLIKVKHWRRCKISNVESEMIMFLIKQVMVHRALKFISDLDWMCTLLSRCTSVSTSGVSSGSSWKLGCISSWIPVIIVASQANTLPWGDTMYGMNV